jgi:hypothetical protein
MLGEVLGAFAARSADRMPIVIVTADHGEGLGEQPIRDRDHTRQATGSPDRILICVSPAR